MKSSPAAIVSLCLLFAGCAQSERWSPRLLLSSDSRTVAFDDHIIDKGVRNVTLFHRGTGTISSVPVPADRTSNDMFWLNDRLYLRTKNAATASTLLDPTNNTWTDAPYFSDIWYDPFVGVYKNQPALYIPEQEKVHEAAIRSLPDLSPLGKLDSTVRGVGNGYMLRYHWPEGSQLQVTSQGVWRMTTHNGVSIVYQQAAIDQMELLDPQLHVVMQLNAAQAAAMKVPFTDNDAQISPDHRTLMLAPIDYGGMGGSGWPSMYTSGWAVLDIATGKPLYTYRSVWPATPSGSQADIRSHFVSPLVLTNDAAYAILEFVNERYTQPLRDDDFQFWLVRFSPEGMNRVIRLDLVPNKNFSTTASPSGEFMLIHSFYPTPRMLEVPLKPQVTEAEIRRYALGK